MSKKIVKAENAPKAIGPYSQAVIAGGFLFCSGQLPVDPQTGELIDGSVADATAQIIKNILVILEEAGLNAADVVKAEVYLKNLDDFAEMNEVYGKTFCFEPPARVTLQVAKLPLDAPLEISVTAKLRD